jgi:uncharacterized protein (TIGR02466 family)
MITLFPTLIEQNQLEFDNTKFVNRAFELRDKLSSKNEWQCDTFSTMDSYNLVEDPIFMDLHITTMLKVLEFAGHYGDISGKNIQCTSSWVNVSSPGNFQEYHVHTNNHFSAVYYVKVPKNSGNIVFRAHDHAGDMFPLPFNLNTEKEPAYRTYFLEPKESELMIFRSNLEHMVQKNNSNEDRISIALNFVLQESPNDN